MCVTFSVVGPTKRDFTKLHKQQFIFSWHVKLSQVGSRQNSLAVGFFCVFFSFSVVLLLSYCFYTVFLSSFVVENPQHFHNVWNKVEVHILVH